jgi:hypothetical protein
MKISIYSETYSTTSLRNIMQKYLTTMSYYVYHIQCQSAVLYQIYQTVLLVTIKPIVSLVKEHRYPLSILLHKTKYAIKNQSYMHMASSPSILFRFVWNVRVIKYKCQTEQYTRWWCHMHIRLIFNGIFCLV